MDIYKRAKDYICHYILSQSKGCNKFAAIENQGDRWIVPGIVVVPVRGTVLLCIDRMSIKEYGCTPVSSTRTCTEIDHTLPYGPRP